MDTELNLVTECWVEPQSGTVMNCMDQYRHFQGLKYQEVPQAIFPRDLTCMSTMMTFEYLSQLCQNKDQVCSLPAGLKGVRAEALASEDSIHIIPFQFDLIQLLPKCQQVELFFLTFSTVVETGEQVHSSPCLPNELLLSLFHSSLEHELSDREILLADSDHVAFMHHILERERDGHMAPFSLPVIKEECVKPPDRQDTMTSFHTTGSSKEVTGSTSTLQSFSNADLVDEEPLLVESSCSVPQWRCYTKYISPQQIFLTFLPATFTDVLMLMAAGLETEPHSNIGMQEDDTLTPSVKSQTDTLSGSTSGLERSESGHSLASKLPRSSSSGHFTSRSPVLSPQSECHTLPADSLILDQDSWDSRLSETETGTLDSDIGEKERVQFSEPQKADFHISFSRQVSQHSTSDSTQLKCPVYIYNCSLEHLKEQLVHPNSSRQPRDIFRSLSQDRSNPSPWTDILAQPHKHKELANYCSLLQEHYHQSFVKGVYRSLQQSYSISSQDILMAMDYCEESLQEIDITSFLQTLCGHIRVFGEHGDVPGLEGKQKPSRSPATFIIGEGEEERPDDRAALVSVSSIDMEDPSESESRGKSSVHTSALNMDESRTAKVPQFPLTLLQIHPKCEVYPDLHRIIQDKFMEILSQYFKPVPSNPHYFFYCPPTSKREEDSEDDEMERRPSEELVSEAELATEDENMSGCCVMTESDTDLVVEYEEHTGPSLHGEAEDQSLSDSNTVNQDQDSFSILEGDSLLDPEGPQLDMPPLFVHVTCSVNMKSCHGSMPIQTLPTCLGEIISCLENAKALQTVDLNDLSVTLDIFVLTLPLEIEVMADFHHNRYTSESSVSLNRSPGQPSSYRSDEELMAVLDSLRGGGVDGVSGDPLSKLPVPHKLAILATMDEIRWLLEDEIVSALRHSRVVSLATLQKVAEHVLHSSGRPHCRCEDVPLQFVFGPEQSLEKFKEEFRRISFSGYVLNGQQDSFYYMSLSRLHPQRIRAAKSLSESTTDHPTHTTPCSAAAQADDMMQEGEAEAQTAEAGIESEDKRLISADTTADVSEPMRAVKPEADDAVYQSSASVGADRGHPRAPQLHTECSTEPTSPHKTPSSVSLAESVQSASHSCSKLRPSRVQSVVSSQGSLDSDMQEL
ncbi:hypothetical protein INR49_008689 [Caranx melampygus]|nr:hypothetical protein INR49_008689 [Caranx melampygus]